MPTVTANNCEMFYEIRLLLAAGANPNARGNNGMTISPIRGGLTPRRYGSNMVSAAAPSFGTTGCLRLPVTHRLHAAAFCCTVWQHREGPALARGWGGPKCTR